MKLEFLSTRHRTIQNLNKSKVSKVCNQLYNVVDYVCVISFQVAGKFMEMLEKKTVKKAESNAHRKTNG